MKQYTVADKSYNKETGELEQFLVFWSGGEPELKRASAENVLLFDPEDVLPFENGMYEFLNGEQALILSEEPEVILAPTSNEYAYMLRVRGNVVETTPKQAERVLEGVIAVAKEGDASELLDLYNDIMNIHDSQVRQHVMNALHETFDNEERIEIMSNGWLIDDYYLVDLSASIYTKDDDPLEDDYVRSSGSVRKDDSYEFVQFSISRSARDMDRIEVEINGEQYRLSEREMLFLAKVKWLLSRRYYHPDKPFWMTADRHASVDWKTGKPEDSDDEEEPNLGKFNI